MRPEKKLFLFSPYNLSKIETSYAELMEKTKQNRATLSSYKTKKYLMKKFGAYLIDANTPLAELRRLAAKVIIKGEQWAKIPGFPNFVSTFGRVKSEKTNDFMIPFINYAGYLAVRFKSDNKYISVPIHRLVATVFLLKGEAERIFYFKNKHSDDYLFSSSDEENNVVHMNRKKFDNRVINLKWVKDSEIHKFKRSNSKAVLKICKKSESILDYYDSIKEAGEDNFINAVAIGNCLKGKTKTSGGFMWRYYNGENIDHLYEDNDCLDEIEQYLSYS